MAEHRFQKTVEIHAPVAKVWEALTIPALMRQWMTESAIEIITNWEKGSSFIIEGNLHGTVFKNKGVVLEYEPMQRLAYSHLSSISAIPDELENYTVIDFTLAPDDRQVALTVSVCNFPTESIYRHMAFYWNVAPEVLKKFVEKTYMVKDHTIQVKPVNATNWADFETLFESKGAPKYCWCMAWRMNKEELKHNDSRSRKKFIKQRVMDDIPIGLLAYSNKEPIGWCSLAPRDSYQRLDGDDNIDQVWSIACFYIKRDFRKQGLVHLFIERAKKYAKKKGAKYLESYPVEPNSPSYRFMGFIETFEKAGFKFVKMAGTRRHIMTCKL